MLCCFTQLNVMLEYIFFNMIIIHIVFELINIDKYLKSHTT